MLNYQYTFKYVDNGTDYTVTFNADVNLEELKRNLLYFLRGCSWSEEHTRFLEEDPEENIRADIMAEQYDRIAGIIKKAKEEDWTAEDILNKLEEEYVK